MKDKWLTKDLMGTISKDPELMRMFLNPEYMQAIQRMKTDPKGVMEQYKNDKDFTKALTKLSKLMGSHFGKIGEKEKLLQ